MITDPDLSCVGPQAVPQQEREGGLEDPDRIETAGVFSEDGLVNVTHQVILVILEKTCGS